MKVRLPMTLRMMTLAGLIALMSTTTSAQMIDGGGMATTVELRATLVAHATHIRRLPACDDICKAGADKFIRDLPRSATVSTDYFAELGQVTISYK